MSKEWGSKQKILYQKELKEVKQEIQNFHSANHTGVYTAAELDKLRLVEKRRSLLIAKEGKISKLKSRDLWLEGGDKNMKYFHRFATHRKNINTILERMKKV